MAGRILTWLGIDRIQWQALVVAYLRMDGRRAGGAARPGEKAGRHVFSAYSGLILMTSISGVFLGIAAVVLEDSSDRVGGPDDVCGDEHVAVAAGGFHRARRVAGRLSVYWPAVLSIRELTWPRG